MLGGLSELSEGRLVLATCERFEVYATTRYAAADRWIPSLAQWLEVPTRVLSECARTLAGPAAAGHLIRVAAGLESRIVGERQILGQVRNAFQLSLERKTLDPQLSMLLRTAIRAGKRVRSETSLACGSRSIVTMALDWLTDRRGGVAERVVVVVGSGRLAALAAAEFAARRPRRLVITGRNESRAAELALRFGAECVAMEGLGQAVAAADVAITCTASASYLVDAGMIGARACPLLLIDLSVPRNVDPSVVRLPGVSLGYLDEMVAHGLTSGTRAVPGLDAIRHAEQIAKEELQSYIRWERERGVAPQIAELFRQARPGAEDRRALHDRIMQLKAGLAA